MRQIKLTEISNKLYTLFLKHKNDKDLVVGEFIGWLDNNSNLVEDRVIKPPKFKPSELNYLEDLVDKNIEEGTYWGNEKQFRQRQKNVKEKIINLRAAL